MARQKRGWLAPAARRPDAQLLGQADRGHHRHLHQAPARRGSARRAGGAADRRRPRPGHRGQADRRARPRPLRQGDRRREEMRELAGRGDRQRILEPVAQPLVLDPAQKPHRRAGGRRQRHRQDHDHRQAGAALSRGRARRSMLAAGDTFRAAAIEQLQIWGERTGAPVIARRDRAPMPPASPSTRWRRREAEGADVLLIDTAGRLQNKADLMDELARSSACCESSTRRRRMSAAGARRHHRPERPCSRSSLQADWSRSPAWW